MSHIKTLKYITRSTTSISFLFPSISHTHTQEHIADMLTVTHFHSTKLNSKWILFYWQLAATHREKLKEPLNETNICGSKSIRQHQFYI